MKFHTKTGYWTLGLVAFSVVGGCSSETTTEGSGVGGAVATAGGATASTGTPSTGGGSPIAAGGSPVATTSGAATGGGITGSGGATGVTGVGGDTSVGVTTGSGGTTASGGKSSISTAAGGKSSTGGSTSTATGGKSSAGGSTSTATGGKSSAGGDTAAGGKSSAGGSTSNGAIGDRPCDIYASANTPCVAAYSVIRSISKAYTGPLYQVRSGSSAQNTGTGGTVTDIGMTADGFADAAAHTAACGTTYCTFSKLYDQSGNGNHLTVAKKGRSDGGTYGATDDFESNATAAKGALTVGGHSVHSLYMAAREGYRLQAVGKNMPRGTAAEGIYMLADGTHYGTACCWDFGNVSTDPTKYGVMNTLFFGTAFWGKGAGNGPWFMADFEAGVWAGGTKAGDPGWGALDGAHPANPSNPSMNVPFAFGILKTTPTNYALRSANGQSGTLTTSYSGGLPKAMDNLGGIVLGVGGDNSNNSWGTFFEGAITAGAPSDATDALILSNVQAAGYGK